MGNKITVTDLCNLFPQSTTVRIYMGGITWEFDSDDIPDQIVDMEVNTIDDPYLCLAPYPLTMNLNENDLPYTIWQEFKREYKDYTV